MAFGITGRIFISTPNFQIGILQKYCCSFSERISLRILLRNYKVVDGSRIHVQLLKNSNKNSLITIKKKSRWLHLISSLVNFGLVCFSLNKLPNMEDLAFLIFFPEFFLWNSFPVTESSEIETCFEISILATWIRQSYSVQEFKIGSDSKNRKK